MDSRPPTSTPRGARDTLDEVRDVARDLRSLDERINTRLSAGAESFSTLRRAVSDAEAKAAKAEEIAARAVSAKPIPWVRVIPIVLTLLTGFAAVVATMARTPSREFVESRTGALEASLRALQTDIVALQKELIEVRAALKSAGDLASRRLDALEKPQAVRRGAR